jgi:2-hydroxychromene-2-carboxylate isomerase
MIIAKRLKGKAIATWLGPAGDAARRAAWRVKQRVTSAPPRLELYFDIGDPWSYLAAQAAARLTEAYPVELAFTVVTPPASDVAPAPGLRASHAVRDAQQLAAYWDVDFPGKREADPGMVRDIGTALIRPRPPAEQLRAALELTGAMWAGDRKQLTALLGTWGTEAHGSVAPILNAAYAELRKAGHYQGAMMRYGGTWYWGVDRLGYLEEALARDLGREAAGVVAPRPEAERGPQKLSDKPLSCEMWLSFRSPYSYLALEQIEAVLAPYDVPLVLRPVPPMVARGLPMPQIKQLYIVRDVKREADRLGIPFGELCDPLGAGVDNCLAIMHWALRRGPADALARAALDDPEAAKAAQANAADLAVVGLWGVPAFRVGDFVAWGQDRLPLLADRLRRNALAA